MGIERLTTAGVGFALHRCPQCNKWTDRLYGGNGRTLVGCWSCWQAGKLDLPTKEEGADG